MSIEKNKQESKRWLHTAEDDLDTSILLKTHNKFAHSCFHAQQAAEKAVKSVWYYEDSDPWGHSIKKLIDDLDEVNMAAYNALANVARLAMILDRFYIPTRYPNGLPDITPDMAFTEEDSTMCIEAAKSILNVIQSYLNF